MKKVIKSEKINGQNGFYGARIYFSPKPILIKMLDTNYFDTSS